MFVDRYSYGGVKVVMVSEDSVRVSWNSIDLPEITGYIVYYWQNGMNKTTINISGSMNSTVVGQLLSATEYQFQVAAINGMTIIGLRSSISVLSITGKAFQ